MRNQEVHPSMRAIWRSPARQRLERRLRRHPARDVRAIDDSLPKRRFISRVEFDGGVEAPLGAWTIEQICDGRGARRPYDRCQSAFDQRRHRWKAASLQQAHAERGERCARAVLWRASLGRCDDSLLKKPSDRLGHTFAATPSPTTV